MASMFLRILWSARVCRDVARPSRARRRMAERGIWRTEILLRMLRRLLAHDLSARGKMHQRRAASAMGKDTLPERRRRHAANGSGIPRGIRCVSGMGFAHRQGKLPVECGASEHAGSALVVDLQCNARFPRLGSSAAVEYRPLCVTPWSRPDCEFCPAHQAAVPKNGSRVNELRV
jgi:hypothetical protein